MTELRHLLGLLSPGQTPGDEAAKPDGPAAAELEPQPGLAQLPTLVDRLTAAGLPIDLRVGELPQELSPGLDLAVFRVIQEALTNVIKHAGKPATTVSLDCRDGQLVVEVVDTGWPILAAAPASRPVPGADWLDCASGSRCTEACWTPAPGAVEGGSSARASRSTVRRAVSPAVRRRAAADASPQLEARERSGHATPCGDRR